MTIIAVFVFIYGLEGARLAKTAISGAVVFTAFGVVLGPLGFGYLKRSLTIQGDCLVRISFLSIVMSPPRNVLLPVCPNKPNPYPYESELTLQAASHRICGFVASTFQAALPFVQ